METAEAQSASNEKQKIEELISEPKKDDTMNTDIKPSDKVLEKEEKTNKLSEPELPLEEIHISEEKREKEEVVFNK